MNNIPEEVSKKKAALLTKVLHHAILRKKDSVNKAQHSRHVLQSIMGVYQSFISNNSLMPSQQGSEGNSKLSQGDVKATAPGAHRVQESLESTGKKRRAGSVKKRAMF